MFGAFGHVTRRTCLFYYLKMINSAFDKFHQSNKSLNDALSVANKHIMNKTEVKAYMYLAMTSMCDMHV